MDRRTLLTTLAATAAAGAAPWARAQNYPEQLIKWVVPYPAGGGTDVIARTLAEAMRQTLGQQIVIDNRPAPRPTSAPTWSPSPSPTATPSCRPTTRCWPSTSTCSASCPSAPKRTSRYIGAIGKFPLALVVHPDFPAKDFKAFLAYVKANPGKVNYASPGNGSPHHLAMEMFKNRTGTFITHIPYRGAAPAMADVMGGQVPCMFLDLASGLPIMQGNKVRVLAIGSGARSKLLPDVPTLAEVGVPNTEVFAFQGILGPAGLPPRRGRQAQRRPEPRLQRAGGAEALQRFRHGGDARHACSSSRRCRVRSRSAGDRSSSRPASSWTEGRRSQARSGNTAEPALPGRGVAPGEGVGGPHEVRKPGGELYLVLRDPSSNTSSSRSGLPLGVPGPLARDAALVVVDRFGHQRALVAEALVRADGRCGGPRSTSEEAPDRGTLAVVVEFGHLELRARRRPTP